MNSILLYIASPTGLVDWLGILFITAMFIGFIDRSIRRQERQNKKDKDCCN